MIKHHDQNELGTKEFIWLICPHHSPSLKEVRAGTQTGKEAGGRSLQWPQTGAAYWLAHSAFLYNSGP